jgi:hypothetical protein
MGALLGVVGEASADLLPDVNANAANRRAATVRVLYMEMPPAGIRGGRKSITHGSPNMFTKYFHQIFSPNIFAKYSLFISRRK